jgi:hypothetical protein
MPPSKNAIVLMAVGKKHQKMYESVRRQFVRYAQKCQADLLVCSAPPDPAFRRNILYQKLLLPSMYRDYDWIAFFDLDVMIAQDAGSVFEHTREDKAFGAVINPIGTQSFVNVALHHWRLPEILNETHLTYFYDRGFSRFPEDTEIVASINGGAFLCDPSKIGDLFKDAYFSDFTEQAVDGGSIIERSASTVDEGIMAHVSQCHNLFFALDDRFNTQFLYAVYEDLRNPIIPFLSTLHYRLLQRVEGRSAAPRPLYPRFYIEFVAERLAGLSILHFAGGFPFQGLICR